jgi:hypothetical protein
VTRLPKIRRPRLQHQTPIGTEIQTLEKYISEAVVTAQVIHAFLAKHEKSIQLAASQCLDSASVPMGEFFCREMQGHGFFLLSSLVLSNLLCIEYDFCFFREVLVFKVSVFRLQPSYWPEKQPV